MSAPAATAHRRIPRHEELAITAAMSAALEGDLLGLAVPRVSFLSVMICRCDGVCPQASRPRAHIAPEADAEPH